MNKEFIPYEQALALKELGFDEPCFGLYHNDKTFYPTQCKSHEQFHGQICSAPLYQQAFRWFREKHNLHAIIEHDSDNYYYVLQGVKDIDFATVESNEDYEMVYLKYEEAELECLKKLIEIVKSKKS